MDIILSVLAGIVVGSIIVAVVGKYLLSRQGNMFQAEIDEFNRTHGYVSRK